MMVFRRAVVLAALMLFAGASGLAGYAYAQAPTVVVIQPGQRVLTYPQGRYELHGDGTASSPYYWVWIPTGIQAVPAPPASPVIIGGASRMVLGMGQRIFTYPEGRYELHGDGTASSPFYWAWIPAGGQVVTIPPIPPLPPKS